MRTAYSYIRFSDEVQRKGDSLRRQTDLRNNWLARHPDCVLDESLRLSDLGVSAFRGKNLKEGALAGFLEAVQSGRVSAGSVLIVESLDRLSRDQVRSALKLFMSLLDSGVSIVTLSPEREYTPSDQDPLVLIEPLIYFSRAHEESSTKSKRIVQSWDTRRQNAGTKPITSVCPKWLVASPDGWKQMPDRVATVKLIFRLSREGRGSLEIAKHLNTNKVPPFGSDRPWNSSYVRMILTDKRALGEFQPKRRQGTGRVSVGSPIPDYYPAVVTPDEFYATLGLVGRRRATGAGRGGAKRENVLAGLVWNADDKSKMYYAHAKPHPRLDTSVNYYKRDTKVGRSFPYRIVEQAVLSMLTELKPEGLLKKDDRHERLSALEGRLTEVESGLAKVNETASRASDPTSYLGLISEYGKRKVELAAEIDTLKAGLSEPTTGLVETQSLIGLRDSKTGTDREAINRRLKAGIQELVESIWLLIIKINKFKSVCHLQLNLKNGESLYKMLMHPIQALMKGSATFKSYKRVDLRHWCKEADKLSNTTGRTAPSESKRKKR